jgi:hypothetical protein
VINIIDIVEKKLEPLSHVAIRFLIENILGFEVHPYTDELPDPYKWGRVYMKEKLCVCIELVDAQDVHYLKFSPLFSRAVDVSEATKTANIVVVESFGIDYLDDALET